MRQVKRDKLNIQEALQKIHSGKFSPVYLVLGTEKYLQGQIKQAFLKKNAVNEEEDLNFASFDMAEAGIGEVIDEAESLPFFGDHRLVFVENPSFLTGEKKANSAELNLDPMLDYLKNPLETTILVFFAPYEKLDERKKITKTLKKNAVLIDAAPPKENELRRYLQQLFDNEGFQIGRKDFDLFLRLTDMNLTKVVTEFQKLKLYIGDEKKITSNIISELIPKTLEHNIFDMINYVLSGNADAALRLFDDLILAGEETIKINAILISQLRLYLQTKILLGIGYQQSNIASTLSLHPYRVKLAMQEVRNFSVKELAVLFDELAENDYRVKTGKIDKNLLFQLFILKVTDQLKKR